MRKLIILFILAVMGVGVDACAQEIVRKSLAKQPVDADEMVIVGNDTVSMIIPQRNYGRYDRGLYNYLFIPRGQWAFGLTASYGELNTEDVRVLDYITDVDFDGKIYSIKPYLSYFLRNNQAVGLRFNYTRGTADLGRLAVDFDDDLNFDIRGVSYYTQSLSASVFYRNYIGLNRNKRFAIFNEVDATVGSGSSRFKRSYNGVPRDTHTTITQGSLNFSPGVCVFFQEHLSFNLSFGVFGLSFRREHQMTDGTDEGTRFSSGANFRFNIFNINFGLMVVI